MNKISKQGNITMINEVGLDLVYGVYRFISVISWQSVLLVEETGVP